MSVASALIESNDHHGNVVTQGGAPWRLDGSLVSADGQHAGTCEVADLEDGTYMLSCESRRGGSWGASSVRGGCTGSLHAHESPLVVFIAHGDTDP
jgi:hypothetical protein